jgi:hypothetical protein
MNDTGDAACGSWKASHCRGLNHFMDERKVYGTFHPVHLKAE